MKNVFLILVSLFFIGCINNKELVVLVKQPHYKELDKLPIRLSFNNVEFYNDSLRYTNIASIFKEGVYNIKDTVSYTLKVQIAGEIFNYKIDYPKDKYIIISPTYKENKILVGILKSDKKYNLQ
jgi:hypothetical protein